MKQKEFKVPCILFPDNDTLSGSFGISAERSDALADHMKEVSGKTDSFNQALFLEECCSICENTNEIAVTACAVGLFVAAIQDRGSKLNRLKQLLDLINE